MDILRKLQVGFTLIELVIVIGVIGVLTVSTLVLIDPQAQMQKAYDAQRKSDLAQMKNALELYYHDYGLYPGSIPFGAAWLPYLQKVPNDPKSGKTYAYTASGDTYYLYASLDRGTTDPQACNSGAVCAHAGGLNCGGICNYGISSANTTP